MKAPFPWFGGKSRAASIIWQRFGNVRNYVEPFAGSLAADFGPATARAAFLVSPDGFMRAEQKWFDELNLITMEQLISKAKTTR